MFAGIHAVLYALFDKDERIDPGAMREQIAFCLETECRGITVLGLATEVLKLTPAERHEMIEITASALAGARKFSVTISGNSVREQCELVRTAEANGADWLILQPPMVGAYDAAVYLDFFIRVAAQTSCPIAIQNAPQYLGRGLSTDDVLHLQNRCPNFAAIKAEDPAEGLGHLRNMAGGSLAILGGRGGQEMIDCLQAGAEGFVLAPEIVPVACRILSYWNAGQVREAQALFAAAEPAIEFTMRSLEHLIAYGKRSFSHQAGMGAVYDRAPALQLDEESLETTHAFARLLGKLCTETGLQN